MIMVKSHSGSVIVTRFQPQAVMPSFHSCIRGAIHHHRKIALQITNAVLFLSFKVGETRHTNGLSPIEVKRVARQITSWTFSERITECNTLCHSEGGAALDRNGWYVLFWVQAIIVLQFVVKSTARSSITSKHRGSNSMRTGSKFCVASAA